MASLETPQGPTHDGNDPPKRATSAEDATKHDESDASRPAVVTGRKAARLLGLFRGDGRLSLVGIESDEDDNKDDAKAPKEEADEATDDQPLSLEPVSSATYFPHLPALEKAKKAVVDDKEVVNVTMPALQPQHMTADVEFDHLGDGDITKVSYKKHDESKRVQFVENSDRSESDQNAAPEESENAPKAAGSLKVSESSSMRDSELESTGLALDAEQIPIARPLELPNASSGLQEPGNDRETSTEAHSYSEFPLAVELRPFKNKVGGHTAIFRFSRKAVCKALVNRENIWYEAVELRHPELLAFMPKYIGVLNVRYSSIVTEDASRANSVYDEPLGSFKDLRLDSPQLHAYSSLVRLHPEDDELPPEVVLDDNKHIIPHLLWKRYSTSAPLGHDHGNEPYRPLSSSSSASSVFVVDNVHVSPKDRPHDDGNSIGATSVNTDLQAQVILEVFAPPTGENRADDGVFAMDEEDEAMENAVHTPEQPAWARRRSSVGLVSPRLGASPYQRKHTRFERFILLEDLTVDMKKPCVLDLKMGTRQYGVEASQSKRRSQRSKCLHTTSRLLGVRMCGLQLWNQQTGQYFNKDKYFGRGVRAGADFCKVLAKFLYDGRLVYLVLVKIPALVEQLEALNDFFSKLHGYRMYGLLVLLMYDGMDPSPIKVRIIDFAQSVIAEDPLPLSTTKPPTHPHLPDLGYLRGLQTLISYFKTMFRVLSGSEFAEDSVSYVVQNRALFGPCPWLDVYGEEGAAEGTDPFEVAYAAYSDDDGISE